MAVTAERTVVIHHPEGLHARPASAFVKAVGEYRCEVELEARGERVSGKSILGVLKLGLRCGDSLTLRATGEDAEAAVARLAALLSGEGSSGAA